MPKYIFTVTQTTVQKYRIAAESAGEAKLLFDACEDEHDEVKYDCLCYDVTEIKDEETGVVFDYADLEYPAEGPKYGDVDDEVTVEEVVHCGNCPWEGGASEANEIQDLHERIEPGGEVPLGECPKCGALCYLAK